MDKVKGRIKLKNGRYHVSLNNLFGSSFADFAREEDAKLWCAYKEDLSNQIIAFDAPIGNLITLDSAIEMKIAEALECELDHRTINSIENLKIHFAELLDKNMNEITYENLLNIANNLMKIEVKHGGSKNSGGTFKLPSKDTLMNRFKYLATVYGCLNKRGMSLTNHPLNVVNYLKTRV